MKAYYVCFPAISIRKALVHVMNSKSRIATPTLIPENAWASIRMCTTSLVRLCIGNWNSRSMFCTITIHMLSGIPEKKSHAIQVGEDIVTRFQFIAILGLFLAMFSAPPRALRARTSGCISLTPTYYIANESLQCVLSSNKYYKCSCSFDKYNIKNCYPYPHSGKRVNQQPHVHHAS